MMAQVYGTATSPAAADRALFARAGYDEDDDTPTIPRNAAFGGDRWGTGHNTTTLGDDPRATGNTAAASQRGRGPASSSRAGRDNEGGERFYQQDVPAQQSVESGPIDIVNLSFG
jgi:hypothetical protein